MAKSSKRKSFRAKAGGLNAATPTSYKDHDLASINPLDRQFEPTEANPIRQHAQMAGDPSGGSLGTRIYEATHKSDDPSGPAKVTPKSSVDKYIDVAERGK